MSLFPINLKHLNDQQRHDYILKTFVLNRAQNRESNQYKRDIDVIKEHHRFLWQEDEEAPTQTWEERLAKRYYDKLFKEYCICDLSRYKENRLALRWRIESEVISGKGQFQCGCRKCEVREDLRTWEVNFAYMEHGEMKNALVKLRLCPAHSEQLNYKSHKREIKRLKQSHKEERRKRKKPTSTDTSIEETLEKVNETNEKDLTENNEKSIEEKAEETPNEQELATSIWSQKLDVEERSREEQFEEYLDDLLF